MAGKIPRTIFALVEPAVWSLAARLLILTTDRQGSKKHQPTVATFYETGIVTALYEALLMSPELAHLEIRHEMGFKTTVGKGAPKQVDLWLRPHNGGHPIMIEAGDFGVGKVHRDLAKLKTLNSNGTNWFLAFFRQAPIAMNPRAELEKSFNRLPRLQLPVGWTPNPVDISFQISDAFPGAPPYGIFVPAGLRYNGAMPQNYTEPAAGQPPFGGLWGVFSWAVADGADWRPSNSVEHGVNLLQWVRGFTQRFLEGA